MSTITVTDVARNLLRDALNGALVGTVVDARVLYFAVGTGTASPSSSDTTLDTEVFRKPITVTTNVGTGETTITCVLGPSDATGVAIREYGWFAGASASSTADTGVLIGRTLYSHTHVITENIEFVMDALIS
jgi:hypothetical protein